VAAIVSIVETCRRLKIPLRDYLGSVLPGLSVFPGMWIGPPRVPCRLAESDPIVLLGQDSAPAREQSQAGRVGTATDGAFELVFVLQLEPHPHRQLFSRQP
jgi:hypothetical protein